MLPCVCIYIPPFFHPWLSGPKAIKLFSCSTQLSTKFILLINVKMQTIVGILTFISMINTTSERLEARNFFIYWSGYRRLYLCDRFFEQKLAENEDKNTHRLEINGYFSSISLVSVIQILAST